MIWKPTRMIGEGNFFYAYILKIVIKFQGEFYFGEGRIVWKGIYHKGKLRLASKNKQDIEDIFNTMELQWPGTALLRIKVCACS